MKKTLCVIILLVSLLLPLCASAEITSEDLANCKVLLEIVLQSDDVSSYDVVCDNEGFIVYETIDGAFFSCVSYATGLSDTAQWDSYILSTVDYMESIRNLLHEATGENIGLLYVMTDPASRDVPFLVVYNGTVIYDFLPTWSWFFSTNE